MTIADPARSKPRSRMRHALARAGDADVVHAEVRGRIKPRPARRHRVPGPFDPDHRARADLDWDWLAHFEAGGGKRQQLPTFLRPQLTGGPSSTVPRGERGVEFGEQLARDCFQAVAARNRSEMLKPDRLTAAFHSALVVPFADAGEVRFEQIVADQRQESAREFASRTDNLAHCGREIIVYAAPR